MMSTQLMWEIIIVIGVFVLLAIIIGFNILVYALGKHSVRDTDELAYIHIDKDGHIRRPIVGKRVNTIESGIAYVYNVDGKKAVVIWPNKYKNVRHYLGKRDIWLNKEGQIISSPFDGDTQLASKEKDDLFHSIFRSQMLVEAVKHISGKKGNQKGIIMLVIIIALIVVVVGAGLGYYAGHQTQTKPTTNTPTQQTQPYILPESK